MRLAVLAVVAACTRSVTSAPQDAPHVDSTLVPFDGMLAPQDQLRFAIVGDTRPPSPDDTAHYPTPIITKIWQDVEAELPHLPFAISTGDYMFANVGGTQQVPQLMLYEHARENFTGVHFPAMGNHECTGATASNCGMGQRDGITRNFDDYRTTMLAPIGVTQPYFVEHVKAIDGSWTAKLVFVACNAWEATQATWLGTALAEPTTYTFVIRHEQVDALSQTPCSASQPIIDANPLTLLIVGHSHTYRHDASVKQIIVGMGGAPLTSGTNYGYVVIARQPDGTLQITAYDYLSHGLLDSFTIQASGAPG